MKNSFEKVRVIFKKHPIWYSVIIFLTAVIVFYSWPRSVAPTYDTMVVAKTDLVQEVEATGKVRPAEERELSFQRGGTVSSVAVEVGDTVKAGQTLVSLDTSELQAQLRQAHAQIDQEQNTLVELQRGVRPEELSLAQTAVSNAELSLADANRAYDNTVQKGVVDMSSVYDGAITSAQGGVITTKNALVSLSEIQYTYFVGTGVSSDELQSAKAVAVQKLFNVRNAELWTAQTIGDLSSGIYGEVQQLTPHSAQDDVLSSALDALNAVSTALGAVPILTSMSAIDRAELTAQKSAVSSVISALSAKLQLVSVQKSAGESALSSVKASVTTAENAVRSAQDALTLKLAGSTKEALATQQSRLSSARAQKDLIETQMRTMTLASPIVGVITEQNARRGVFVGPGAPVVSIISSGGFEVEIFVPEIDVTKISVSDNANITFDAYTDSDIFKAVVSSIDPSETILEGVSTYKITLAFVEKDTSRIRSGMTANVAIFTDERTQVLAVPTRAIVSEEGQKKVRIVQDGKVVLTPVVIGLRSSDGRTEIVSGLNGGEEVITFMPK